MSRSVAYRKTCNDLVFWRQCQALSATIYILRETGPTGFLLKEEGETKPVKAYLGDPHKCTCSQFLKDRDLCRHLCWLILKKFRVAQTNPISWQLGLVDRELNEVLHGQPNKQPPKTPARRWATSGSASSTTADSRPTIRQKDITDDDCCPICQDELLNKHIPVTFCKFGCGNSIHIKCMKVYAEHQKSTGDTTIKCPFCREDFGPIELLKQESRNAMGVQPGGRMDRHLGSSCQSCHVSPIEGKCYRCSICAEYYLCQQCFNTQIHTQHPFDYRHKRNQRWRPAQRTYGAMLPQAVADQLVNRDITEADFELLMQLDNNNVGSDIPEEIVNSFPLEKVRDNSNLFQPGMQCRICLRGYELGQYVRKLPRCKHKFHKECIDNWLLHSHATCPADGTVVWDPVTAQAEAEEKRSRERSSKTKGGEEGPSKQDDLSLILPGVGIIRQDRSSENKADSSKGSRRPPVKSQRLSSGSSSADVNKPIRASFTLDGKSVGPRTNENEPEATSSNHLPGSRLLNRNQSQRQTLHNHMSSFGSQPGSYQTDSRSQSQRSLQGLRITPRNSAMSEASPDSRNVSAQSENVRRNSRSRRPEDNGRWSQSESEASASGTHSVNQSEPVPFTESLSDRLQEFQSTKKDELLDLYLGNDPRDQPAVNRLGNLPPRPARRVLNGNNRRRNNIRRVRSNEFSLDGNALANVTLRDMI